MFDYKEQRILEASSLSIRLYNLKPLIVSSIQNASLFVKVCLSAITVRQLSFYLKLLSKDVINCEYYNKQMEERASSHA